MILISISDECVDLGVSDCRAVQNSLLARDSVLFHRSVSILLICRRTPGIRPKPNLNTPSPKPSTIKPRIPKTPNSET